MSRTITIHWTIDDGYVGSAKRPQTTVLTESNFDFEDYDDANVDERDDFIENAVRSDFKNRISFNIEKVEQ